MTASVPSRMALATSEASARVGRGFSIMLSSIWVAVITALARGVGHLDDPLLERWAPPRWTSPRPGRPRATITPSAASRIAGRSSMASRFSILAMTGAVPPSERMRALRLLHVRGLAHEREGHVVDPVLDAEGEVAPVLLREGRGRRASRRAGSCPCSSAGARRGRPRTPPPGRDARTTCSSRLPSSRRIRSPGVHVAGQRVVGGGDELGVPSTVSSVVMVMRGAVLELDGSPPCTLPVRILGPERSCSTATGRPQPRRDLAHAREHGQVLGVLAVGEVQPDHVDAGLDEVLEHLGSREAGPMVATIFVCLHARHEYTASLRMTRTFSAALALAAVLPAPDRARGPARGRSSGDRCACW